MRKTLLQHGFIASLAVFAVAVASPVAYALPAQAQTTDNTQQVQTTTTPTTTEGAPAAAQERQAAAKTKAAEAKLKACEKRKEAVKNIMTRVSDRGTKQIEVFGTIADRTKAFYVEKGNTAANYDTLVAAVTAKKTAAEAAVAATAGGGTAFNCESGDARAAATALKDTLKTQNTALKEYKVAIKDLIVAVKTAQSNADSTTTEGNE